MLRQNKLLQNRRFRIFLKTFVISVSVIAGVLALAAAIGAVVLNSTIQPPDIPVIQAPLPHVHTDSGHAGTENNDGNTYNDEQSEADVTPPVLARYEERRPLFFTFLIFGLTEGLNANTIMVGAYDGEARRGYVISIPRDTLVDVPRNHRKIVAAYPSGMLGGRGHAGGVNRLKDEVASLVGFRPDFYVRVDYEAFVRLVDAVGGVEVYVPFHMRYDDPWQNLHIDIPAGMQLLDGEDALRFARYRRGNRGFPTISDYQRIEHQQQVIAGALQRLLTPAAILQIPEFISIFNSYFSSDLSYGELLWFANEVRQIYGTDDLSFYTIPMLGTSGAPYWYELADQAGILELVNRTINPLMRDITPSDVRIARWNNPQ